MDLEYAKDLLAKNIKDYEMLAEDFSRTRQFTWDIEILSQYTSDGDTVLDLGCGNGRLLEVLKKHRIEYFGPDASKKLIEIARQKYPQNKFEVGDILNLPYSDNFFNKVFAIRTLHHIPSKEFRLQALKEIRRVLKPGGVLILTVWNVWGSKYKINLLRVIKYSFLKIIGKTKLDFGDTFIPWWKMGEKVKRYFHFFTKKELKNLTEEVGLEVEKIWSSKFRGHSDIYLIAKKPS
jgi:ubiquinone/menaquinone biosynthesis C-methylase UbiE